MNEGDLERRLRDGVKERGGKALKLTSPGRAGMPDRLVLFPGGRVVFVEMKAPGEKLRPLQQKRAEELRALGFEVYCLDNAATVEDFLVEVLQ